MPVAENPSLLSRRRRQRGFTLVELAIVTAIIGLLAAGAVASFGSIRVNTKIKETHRALHSAELLLQAFVARNGRLPCPADPTLSPDDANYAIEASGGAGTGSGCAASQQAGARFWGTLPALSLGAPPREITDGWDRQMFYYVVGSATLTDSLTNGVWAQDGDNEYELFDKADDDTSLPARRQIVNRGVLAVMSAGPNGNGAYTLEGSRLAVSPVNALAENDNQDTDNSLVMSTYSENANSPYDDIVRVLTEDGIITPLAQMGDVQSKRALTLTRMARIENAIYGYAATRSNDPDDTGARAHERSIPRSDDVGDGTMNSFAPSRFPYVLVSNSADEVEDAWGNAFLYDPEDQVAVVTSLSDTDADAGIYGSSSIGFSTVIFTLTSFGPNGVAGGNDDIVLSPNLSEALGRFVGNVDP